MASEKKQGYFFRLWQQDRRLFFFVCSFVLGTSFFNLLGVECSPFFVWAMFSEKEYVKETYSHLELEADGVILPIKASLWEANEHFLMGPIWYYQAIKDNENIDLTHSWLDEKIPSLFSPISPFYKTITLQASEFEDFEKWAKDYASYSLERPIDELKVSRVELRYDEGRPIKVAKQLLFEQ